MAKETKSISGADTDEIIYVPGNADPVNTSVGGVDFRANVPVTVKRSHTVPQLHPEKFDSPEGPRTKHVEKRVPLAEVLAGNHFFVINGVHHKRKMASVARLPDSPDAYRGYALAWISASPDVASLELRWNGEEVLRARCGVSRSEIDYIQSFFGAKVMQLGGDATLFTIDPDTGKIEKAA